MPRTRGKLKKGMYRDFASGHNTRLLSSEEQKARNSHRDYSLVRGIGTKDWYLKENTRAIHIQVAEAKLGRALLPGEIVHHKDENKKNNHPDNLEVYPSQSEHMKEHHRMKKLKRSETRGAEV
jgi:hypothetical protein